MSAKDKSEPLYRILFKQHDTEVELFARFLFQSDLYGFVELEQLVFVERSTLVVDPEADKLRAQFEGVRRTFLPLQSVVRIDEIDLDAIERLSDDFEPDLKSNVTHFPTTFQPPREER